MFFKFYNQILFLSKIAGIMRQDIINAMLNDPIMLDELDFLYKTDNGRKILFYFQVQENTN